MANIFIIHGSYGYPEENWFPWLKEELTKLGHEVYVPKFPTPEGQELEIWLDIFKKYLPLLDSDAILIGHSCGAAFILRLLERINIKVKACILVAGPAKPTNNQFDKVHMGFVEKEYDWKNIKKHADKFYVFHAEDDPYVPIEHGEEIAENLHVKLIKIENAGHFNAKTGYTRFEFLLELLKREIL
ncbi:MAG: alpha/beta hydrolase [Nanoarchaeota archaeon]|nr:alpha/beta hydrolase [Nanoarchaeota archaeon]